MTDKMPETIWVEYSHPNDTWFSRDDYPGMLTEGHTNYTRTDIHESVIAERDALKAAVRTLEAQRNAALNRSHQVGTLPPLGGDL